MKVGIMFQVLWTLLSLYVECVFTQNSFSGTTLSKIGCIRPQDNPVSNEPSVLVSGLVSCVKLCVQQPRCEPISCQGVVVAAQPGNVVTCTKVTDFTGFPNVEDTNCNNSEYPLKVYRRHTNCPTGWTFFGNHCYKFIAEQRTSFSKAQAACHRMGAYLAKPMSRAENAFLVKLSGGGKYLWIGLNDMAKMYVFVWEDGCILSADLAIWGPKQPNGGNYQNCVRIAPNGGWEDRNCDFNWNYVCQRPTIR